jgi:hypothetical protein
MCRNDRDLAQEETAVAADYGRKTTRLAKEVVGMYEASRTSDN